MPKSNNSVPRIEPKLSLDEYLGIDALSGRDVVKLLKSPRHYNYCKDRAASPTMVKGAAIHCAVFESKRFAREYVTFGGDKRTKEYKEFKTAHEGKVILDTDDYTDVVSIAESVREHAAAGPLIEGGQSEISAFWPDNGIRCKGRLDLLKGACIVELKSTTSVAPDDFTRTSFNMSYHIKYRWYQRGVLAITGRLQPVFVIAVEQAAPYDVVVYRVPEYALEYADEKINAALDMYRECEQNLTWPGISAEIQMLDLPAWVRSQYQPPVELTLGGQKMEL